MEGDTEEIILGEYCISKAHLALVIALAEEGRIPLLINSTSTAASLTVKPLPELSAPGDERLELIFSRYKVEPGPASEALRIVIAEGVKLPETEIATIRKVWQAQTAAGYTGAPRPIDASRLIPGDDLNSVDGLAASSRETFDIYALLGIKKEPAEPDVEDTHVQFECLGEIHLTPDLYDRLKISDAEGGDLRLVVDPYARSAEGLLAVFIYKHVDDI